MLSDYKQNHCVICHPQVKLSSSPAWRRQNRPFMLTRNVQVRLKLLWLKHFRGFYEIRFLCFRSPVSGSMKNTTASWHISQDNTELNVSDPAYRPDALLLVTIANRQPQIFQLITLNRRLLASSDARLLVRSMQTTSPTALDILNWIDLHD